MRILKWSISLNGYCIFRGRKLSFALNYRIMRAIKPIIIFSRLNSSPKSQFFSSSDTVERVVGHNLNFFVSTESPVKYSGH